jgi:energy-coupling factor transporter ATP-binding protein EcfA2
MAGLYECETARVFAVLVTGAAGVGKTTYLTALTDVLADDGVAHAAIDSDDVSWAYPYPDLSARTEYIRRAWDAHRDRGHELLLLSEVVESAEHLGELLDALRVDDHLLVRLTAPYMLLRQRILAREPVEWSGTQHLLQETRRWAQGLDELDGVHLTIDTVRTGPLEAAARIRAERPAELGG